MSSHRDFDPERAGLHPGYDYAEVERRALARAVGLGVSRAAFLRRAAALTAGVAALPLLAACGDDEDSGSTAASATSEAAPATSAPATSAAATTEAATTAEATTAAETAASSASAPAVDISGQTINFFSWQGYDIPDVAKPWLDEHGVKFNAKYFQTNEDILVALRQGGGKSPTNLSTYFVGDFAKSHALGAMQEIDLSQIPNAQILYPFLSEDPLLAMWAVDGTWFGMPYTFGGNTLLYDSEKVPTPPASWNELLAPEWKNRFVIVDDATATFAMGAHILGIFHPEGKYTQEQAEQVFAKLTEFKDNARTVADYGAVPDMFAAGETEAATASWAAIANQAAAKGKTTIKSTLPEEGATSFIDAWFMPPAESEDNNPAVLAFIDFSLSPEAQAGAAKSLSGGVMTPDAVALLDEATLGLYPYDDLASFFTKAPIAITPAEAEGDYLAWDDIGSKMWEAWKAS